MELLKDIRHAEGEGEKMVADARHTADELIRSAREEAKKIFESVREESRQAEIRLLAEQEQSARGYTEKLWEENQKQKEALRASAEKKMEQAVHLIINAIAEKS